MLTLAIAKGRLQAAALPLLGKAGYSPPGPDALERRLVWSGSGLRLVLAKPADVPTLVRHGGADAGICGSDVLGECQNGLAEPLPLGIGRCRLALAAPEGGAVREPLDCHGRRVATKYPRAARRFFEALAVEAALIPMHGSVEIAPLTGLAEAIVDLVETGRTLRDNGLREIAFVAPVEARLVAGRASLRLKAAEMDRLIRGLRAAVAAEAKP